MGKQLNLLAKLSQCGAKIVWAAIVAPAALALSGCISSTSPCFATRSRCWGARTIHNFSIRDGAAHDPKVVQFDGRPPLPRAGRRVDIIDSLRTHRGRDFIVQSRSRRGAR